MDIIREHFERTVKITDADWHIFSSKLSRQEKPKRTVLLKQGQTEQYLSFIEKGVIRFYIPGEEDDFTFSFAFANSFFSAYDSFLTQSPCNYQVQAITDTVLWQLAYSDLQQIFAETSVGEKIGRLASEELFLKKSKRELALLTTTAEQRYLSLFTEQPQLLKYIPLKYIASYIGITPQALSRIRKRIS